MINDVKLIYITCGFLRLICSVLLTVCSHFKVNLSIGQFISFQKEQRLLPVFPLLNATVRIIEPLATTFRKELLRIKCRFDSCRERYEDSVFAFARALFSSVGKAGLAQSFFQFPAQPGDLGLELCTVPSGFTGAGSDLNTLHHIISCQ